MTTKIERAAEIAADWRIGQAKDATYHVLNPKTFNRALCGKDIVGAQFTPGLESIHKGIAVTCVPCSLKALQYTAKQLERCD